MLAFFIFVSNGTVSSKIFIFSSILSIITRSGFSALTRRGGEQYPSLEGYGTGCRYTSLPNLNFYLKQLPEIQKKHCFFFQNKFYDKNRIVSGVLSFKRIHNRCFSNILLFRRANKGFKGTVINRPFPSLHGGSLKFMLTVPLKQFF